MRGPLPWFPPLYFFVLLMRLLMLFLYKFAAANVQALRHLLELRAVATLFSRTRSTAFGFERARAVRCPARSRDTGLTVGAVATL